MLQRSDSGEKTKTGSDMETEAELSTGKQVFRGTAQFFLMSFILFCGYAGMNWLTSLKTEPPTRPPFKTVYTVTSVIAEQSSFQPEFTVYGEVQATQSIELRPLVAGQIISVNPELKVGARIEKGTELFKIDPFAYEKELATANSNISETVARIAENRSRITMGESNIRSLRDQLVFAQNDLERFTRLKERGTATDKQLEDRKLVVSQRQQSLEQAELNLVVEQTRVEQLQSIRDRFDWTRKQAERNIQDTVLRAPLTGIISQENVAEGRLINANDMAVAMYRDDRLEVRFTLTDQRFGRIQSDVEGIIGREIEVIWAVGGEEFRYPAKIERISAQITSSRGGVEVIASMEMDAGDRALRPGAFVEIIVPDKRFENHFRLPETALYGNDTVYVISEGKISARQVALHAYDGDHVIVSGNLADGQEIMTTRIAEISDGLLVRSPAKIREPSQTGANSNSQSNDQAQQ